MVAGDAVAAMVFVALIRVFSEWPSLMARVPVTSEPWHSAALLSAVAATWLVSLHALGAYEFPLTAARETFQLAVASSLAAITLVLLSAAGTRAFLVFWPVIAITGYLFRSAVSQALLRLAGHATHARVLVVGQPELIPAVREAFVNRNGYRVLAPLKVVMPAVDGSTALATDPFANLFRELELRRPDEVVVALNSESDTGWGPVVSACRQMGIACQFAVSTTTRISAAGLRTHNIGDLAIVYSQPCALEGLNLRLKQALDLTVGGLCLVLTLPFMALIALAIRLDSRGPAIIRQTRIGYKGKPFTFYKFRSMYVDSDDSVHRTYTQQWIQNQPATGTGPKVFKIVKDKRITRVGAILRRYSIDEWPQIFNVVKLEMSLVGPRPALPYEVESYREWHKQRFDAPPGMTGLWQVSGRNRLSFDEMAQLDIDYLRRWSFPLELKILAKTIPTVLGGTGH